MRVTTFIFLFFIANFCVCQTRLFTQEDGLSSKDITAIIQSENGCLWVGTSNGLNRYNGYEFSLVDKMGLSNGKIKTLYEDKNGMLWIGTLQGLCILNQNDLSVKWFFHNNKNHTKKISTTIINCISEYINGSVLVGTSKGELFLFDNDSSFRLIYRSEHQITGVCSGKNGEMWVVEKCLFINKLNKHFEKDENFHYHPEDITNVMLVKDSDNLFLLDRWGYIVQMSGETGKRISNSLLDSANTKYRDITIGYSSNKQILWTGYESSAFIKIDFSNSLLTNYNNEIKPYLKSPPRTICEDKSGLVWIGTNDGLIKLYPRKKLFENYLQASLEEREKKSVRGIVETQEGDIYIGGYAGLFKIKKGSKAAEEVPTKLNKEIFPDKKSIPYRFVDDGNYIWVASETKGVYKLNKTTQEIKLPLNKIHPEYKNSYTLLEEGKDSMWIGTNKGLFIYRRKSNELSKRATFANDVDISDIIITDLAKNSKHTLWIGSRSTGLIELDLKNNSAKIISDSLNRLMFITCLFLEHDSMLWVGTRGSGIARMNTHTHKIKFFTKKEGLADNSVASFTTDNFGDYWIGTFNGLSKLNRKTERFENYYEKDGLTDNEFNIAACLKTKDGKLFFGGINGVNSFYPSQIKKEREKNPFIYLSKLLTYNNEKNTLVEQLGNLSELQTIHLSHKNSYCSFTFFVDDYYNPLKNTFSYMLEGYDEKWKNLGNQNTISFNSLPSGEYRLVVKGSNSEGLTTENQLTYHIKVSQAFYRTIWFYLLLCMICVLITYAVTRYKVSQRFKMQKLRTKISSDLHDEVGGLLTRISIHAEMIKQGISSENSIEDIADTSRQATTAMNDVLWSIDARNDKIGSLIDHMREHAAQILFPLDIEVAFTIKGIEPEKELDSNIRRNLFLIFKEAINNIAKHSNAVNVNVSIEKNRNELIMTIEDNGTKNKTNNAGSGQGLTNMNMRANDIGAELNIVNDNGYKITLTIKNFVWT